MPSNLSSNWLHTYAIIKRNIMKQLAFDYWWSWSHLPIVGTMFSEEFYLYQSGRGFFLKITLVVNIRSNCCWRTWKKGKSRRYNSISVGSNTRFDICKWKLFNLLKGQIPLRQSIHMHSLYYLHSLIFFILSYWKYFPAHSSVF